MNKHLEYLIDDIVKYIDDDIFTEDFDPNQEKADLDLIEENRDGLREILEPFVDDSEFLKSLRQAGIEDWSGYEDAVELYGKPVFDE